MKQALAIALTGVFLAPVAQQEQAYLAILAETKVGRMAGMPMFDLKDLPPGFKLPPEAMMFAGQPSRLLHVRLWSPSLAPANAKASVAPPSGLKLGAKLDLDLYRPEPGATGSTQKDKNFDPDSNPEFTVKIYWGSSDTVRDGQPKVIKWTDIPADQKEAIKERNREVNRANSYFYKPNWTTGYWPTKAQPGSIDKAASLVGKYALTTTYTGNVEIEAPSNVDFLDPIVISSPNLEKKLDLKKSIPLIWKEIPNALGLNGMAIGMEGKNTLIMWSSSEVFTEGLMSDMGFLQMAEVRDFVQKTVFMPGNKANVTIPAGIFQGADFAMFNMAGYGPGAALDKAQPLPRIQTKTSLMIMLGGKKMPDMTP
ncbi:MAG: hypothetical protein H7Y17_09140 [Chlorobia bacterium]|nr:hypothetical protein [Fimbriimonadaceae bacterium]